jgi:hypothetical protein
MKSDEIEKFLKELGAESKRSRIKKPVRLMFIGGAYMLLLANAPCSTNDIDVFWLEEDMFQQVFHPLRGIPRHLESRRREEQIKRTMWNSRGETV